MQPICWNSVNWSRSSSNFFNPFIRVVMDVRNKAIQCFKDEAEAVLGLIPQLDEDFDKAVELMLHCKGKIVVTGVGKSGHVGAKIAAPL